MSTWWKVERQGEETGLEIAIRDPRRDVKENEKHKIAHKFCLWEAGRLEILMS